MTASLTCMRCHERITAEDEDELVAQVQAHARDHGGAHRQHVPSREHILSHLHRRDPEED
jgi:predicted small metal-binding protein